MEVARGFRRAQKPADVKTFTSVQRSYWDLSLSVANWSAEGAGFERSLPLSIRIPAVCFFT